MDGCTNKHQHRNSKRDFEILFHRFFLNAFKLHSHYFRGLKLTQKLIQHFFWNFWLIRYFLEFVG